MMNTSNLAQPPELAQVLIGAECIDNRTKNSHIVTAINEDAGWVEIDYNQQMSLSIFDRDFEPWTKPFNLTLKAYTHWEYGLSTATTVWRATQELALPVEIPRAA